MFEEETELQSFSTWYQMDMFEEETQLQRFSKWYEGVHGYVSVVICVFGLMCNTLNIAVFTQKNMITSINVILTGLAVADMLTVAAYLPYAIYLYCIAGPDPTNNHPFGWVVYLIFTKNLVLTVHTITAGLTIALAVFRYIEICHHTLHPKFCNLQRAKLTVCVVFLASCVFHIPNYVEYTPTKLGLESPSGYWFKVNDFISTTHRTFNFWFYGVALKLVLCLLLIVLTLFLIRAMWHTNVKQRRLKSQGNHAESKRTREQNCTTAMVIAIVMCFVVVELPQGIVALLSGIDTNILMDVSVHLGDIWDIIVLIYAAIKFWFYCTISKEFRQTFKHVFVNCKS